MNKKNDNSPESFYQSDKIEMRKNYMKTKRFKVN